MGDKRIAVDRFALYGNTRGDGLYESSDSIGIVMNSQAIKLYIKADDSDVS